MVSQLSSCRGVDDLVPQRFVNWLMRVIGWAIGSMWFLVGVAAVDRAELADGLLSMLTRRREYVVLILANGKKVEFAELNCKLLPEGEPSLTRNTVAAINAWIHNSRGVAS